MIYFFSGGDFNFLDFGIEIPLKDRVAPLLLHVRKNYSKNLVILDEVTKLSVKDLSLAHTDEYSNILINESLVEGELFHTFELVDSNGEYNRYNPRNSKYELRDLRDKILLQVSAIVSSARMMLREGHSAGFYLGGGMHHAMSCRGSGFCLVNDIVITIRTLQQEGRIRNAFVIDVDAHKGDGTAEITKNDATITTLSIHMEKGWPLTNIDESSPSHIPSSVDIPVGEHENRKYLTKLSDGLSKIQSNPDIVFVVLGSDPHIDDELDSSSKIKLTTEEMLERDRLVFNFAKERGIPQFYLMGGGYGRNAWKMYSQFLDKVMFA